MRRAAARTATRRGAELLRELGHDHGASAAIAFVAAFLAAFALRIFTQPVQNSLRGRYLVHLGDAALVVEADGLVHGGR